MSNQADPTAVTLPFHLPSRLDDILPTPRLDDILPVPPHPNRNLRHDILLVPRPPDIERSHPIRRIKRSTTLMLGGLLAVLPSAVIAATPLAADAAMPPAAAHTTVNEAAYWHQFGFSEEGDRNNPFVTAINRYSVHNMVEQWSETGGCTASGSAVVDDFMTIESFGTCPSQTLTAYNMSTRKVIWSVAPQTGISPQPSAPAVTNGIVYLATGSSLASYDLHTGAFMGARMLNGGIVQAPVTGRSGVYVEDQSGNVYAFDFNPLSLRWTANVGPTGAAGLGGPSVLQANSFSDKYVFADSSSGGITALNASTGQKVWSTQLPSPALQSPTWADGKILVSTTDGVDALNASTGAMLWSTPTPGGIFQVVAASGIAVEGTMAAFTEVTATGQEALIWLPDIENGLQSNSLLLPSAPTGGTLPAPSSPALINGVMYVGTFGGSVEAVWNFQVLWTQALGGPVSSSPAVCWGHVYIGDNAGNLFSFVLK